MQLYPSSLAVLIESLKKLPGIGAKTAQRLAIHLLHAPKGEAEGLARAILDAREKIFFCSVCGNLTDKDPCDLCRDERRDQSLLCVVEWPRDIIAFERTREFPGVYHVIHGVISPMDGIGPDDLKINELLQRASKESIKEVVIATNPNHQLPATTQSTVKTQHDTFRPNIFSNY